MTHYYLTLLLLWHGVYVPVQVGPMPGWVCRAVVKTLPNLSITAGGEGASIERSDCVLIKG